MVIQRIYAISLIEVGIIFGMILNPIKGLI